MSSKCDWESLGDESGYFFGRLEGKEYHIIFIEEGKEDSLSRIVHEINECEITRIFMEMKLKVSRIKITKKMKKAFKGFNKVGDKIYLSHIIAPYGKENCLMPRKNYRLRW